MVRPHLCQYRFAGWPLNKAVMSPLGLSSAAPSLPSPLFLATLSSALIIFFATYQSLLSRESSSLIHYINLDQNILWVLSHRRIYSLRQVPPEGRQAVFPLKGTENGILVPNPTSRQPLPWVDSFEHVTNSRALQKCHIATPLDK